MSLSESVMRKCAPVRTGALRRSISAERSGNEVLVGPSVFYAEFADLGVRPHMIYGQPVLHWDDAFARQVRHPGYPGSFFIERSEEILTPQIEDLAETFLKQAGV
jgi:phage gpG-like protein